MWLQRLAKFILLGIFLWLALGQAWAQGLLVEPRQEAQSLAPALAILQETAGPLQAQELADLGRFTAQQAHHQPLAKPFLSQNLWIRWELVNPMSQPLERILYSDTPLDKAELYQLEQGQAKLLQVIDYQRLDVFATRPSPYVYFSLNLPPGTSSYLLKLVRPRTGLERLELMEPGAFWVQIFLTSSFMAFFVGVCFLIACYNIFLAYFTRCAPMWYFAGWSFFTPLLVLVWNPHLQAWFGQNAFLELTRSTDLRNLLMVLVSLSLWSYSYALIGLSFHQGRWGKLFLLTTLGPALVFLGSPWNPWAWQWLLYGVSFNCLLLLGLLIYFVRMGSRPAFWVLGSTGLTIVGGLFQVFFEHQFEINLWYSAHLGILVEGVILSVYMTVQWSSFQRKIIRTQEKLINSINQNSKVLEEQVAERTSQLLRSNRTKDRFLAMIGHDLQGPVSALAAAFSTLKDGRVKMDQFRLSLFSETTQALSRQMEELLLWARNQEGKLIPRPQAFALAEEVEKVLLLLQAQAEAKGILFERNLHRNLRVEADLNMISAILRNLLSNSLKYCPPVSRIQIELLQKGSEICLSLANPCSPSDLAMLKKALGQGEPHPREQEGHHGTGLGLELCLDFLNANQGRLELKQPQPNLIQIVVSLPAAKPLTEIASAAKRGSNLQVLILSQEPDCRVQLCDLMEHMGLLVDLPLREQEMLEALELSPLDLVLVDLELANQPEFLQALQRQQEQGAWLISFQNSQETTLIRPRLAFAGHLAPPFQVAQALDLMRRIA